MKKLIRLTEGQLHEMITESVSQILSELDWKTYLNYANKRYMQNLKKSGDRGYDKATKAFMDKYLPKGHQGRQYTDSHEYKIEPSFTRDTGYLDMSMKNNERTIPTTYFGRFHRTDDGRLMHDSDSRYVDRYDLNSLDNKAEKDEFRQNARNAVQDMGAYYGGKSKYIKGKGWVNQ